MCPEISFGLTSVLRASRRSVPTVWPNYVACKKDARLLLPAHGNPHKGLPKTKVSMVRYHWKSQGKQIKRMSLPQDSPEPLFAHVLWDFSRRRYRSIWLGNPFFKDQHSGLARLKNTGPDLWCCLSSILYPLLRRYPTLAAESHHPSPLRGSSLEIRLSLVWGVGLGTGIIISLPGDSKVRPAWRPPAQRMGEAPPLPTPTVEH